MSRAFVLPGSDPIMGCDIHLYAEVKEEIASGISQWYALVAECISCARRTSQDPADCWRCANTSIAYDWDSGRNYILFSILADVRNYRDIPLVPIDTARGLPNDVSDEIAHISKRWAGDGHSHSHLTVKEIEEYGLWDDYIDFTDGDAEQLRAVCKEFLEGPVEKLKTYAASTDDIRFVFFFDN